MDERFYLYAGVNECTHRNNTRRVERPERVREVGTLQISAW